MRASSATSGFVAAAFRPPSFFPIGTEE